MRKISTLLTIIAVLLGGFSMAASARGPAKVIKVYAGNAYTIGLCSDGSVKFAGERRGRWDLSDRRLYRKQNNLRKGQAIYKRERMSDDIFDDVVG